MSNQLGRFEILGEIADSAASHVYKANDPESKQIVALKTFHLDLLGDRSAPLLETFLEEAENTKVLNSPNIALLYGAGEIERQFCAAIEYIQGKSIASMLRVGDEFSIWDLQDIARQSCQGLDHAHARRIFHYSLEPDKLMVQWDGTVKILGFGISSLSIYSAQESTTSALWQYMSPEQVRGEPLDARSNLFSLGAILYEMATGRAPFQAERLEDVRQQIVDAVPVPPNEINQKLHAAVSHVILKALSKEPNDRYHSGLELVRDLERRPEEVSSGKSKSASLSAGRLEAAASTRSDGSLAAAAAAGASGSNPEGVLSSSMQLDATEQFISSCIKASVEAICSDDEQMSAAPALAPRTASPNIPVDPLMGPPPTRDAETGERARSFSEISELPPLKETYVPPASFAAPPIVEEGDPLQELREPHFQGGTRPATAKAQTAEIAEKAVAQIRKTPPKLFLYSLGAAAVIILLVTAVILFRIHSENADVEGGSRPSGTVASANAPGSATTASAPQPSVVQPAPAPSAKPAPETEDTKPTRISVTARRAAKKPVKPPVPVAVIMPGQLTVNSTPEGAHVQVDGQGDPSWVTPYDITGLTPGHHTVTLSKTTYAIETRTIEIASRSKSFLVVQLALLPATVLVAAEPAGSQILLDGKDTGRVTPSQLTVAIPGPHTFQVKKQGYLDETTTLNLQPGQALRFTPTLRQLGMTDDIKPTNKLKKLFGGGGPDDMGRVAVKTQPKNAQIAVNKRILDKNSPVEFYLNPGTYVIDVTLTGYKSIQRVVTVEKGGKLLVDEILNRE